MRIIVSDRSCLIDLRKVGLVEAFLKLPYEFLIPNTLFEDELLKSTAAQKRALVKGGLTVTDLPGERVLRAQGVIREQPRLTLHDGFAFALAEGLLLGSFRFDRLKSKKDEPTPATISFLNESFASTLAQATIICDAANLTRAWAHEPANVINPVTLAERVQELAKEVGLECTVLDDKQLTEMGCSCSSPLRPPRWG